jgi:iron(III) transport system substrate-binding protein
MLRFTTALTLTLATALPALAQEVNVYSSRHYDTDLALYEAFTAQTGIRVNLIEGEAPQLMERIQSEGASSPADVFITVDGGRLHLAVQAGILQPVESAVLEERIPASFQHPDNLWFGLTSRVRVMFYRTADGKPDWLNDYEDLADERARGEVCMRSSGNIYSVSLMAELIEALGAEAAEAWAAGLNANLAREPQGGDTDQLRALAAGECDIAVSNTYYWGRLAASTNPEDVAVAQALSFVYPNQDDRGAHVNISGAGVVATAPNRDNAVRFIEFLASDQAQQVLADQNNEFPVVAGVTITGPMAAHTDFRGSGVNVAIYGTNAAQATEIFDRVGMP